MNGMSRFVSFLMLIAISTEIVAIKVRIYEENGKRGYFNEVKDISNLTCTNIKIPQVKTPITEGSIETDTCLMIYAFEDCTGPSAKIYPGSYNINHQLFNIFLDKYVKQEERYGKTGIHSIIPCSETLGGRVLNVDILWNSDKEKIEFKDICGCRNLPTTLLNLLRRPRADNHGNDFMKYTEPDCKGEQRFVPAGQNEESEFFYDFGEERIFGQNIIRKRIVESIGPVTSSEYYQNHCVRLTGNIYKFEFFDSNGANYKPRFEEVLMANEGSFRNDGKSKIIETYIISKKVEEKTEIEFVETLSNMFKVEGEVTVTVGGTAGIPFVFEGSFKAALKASIAYEHRSEDKKGTKKIVGTVREFTINKKIEIPPCTDYSVRGIVKKEIDRPLEYRVYTTITGEFGETGERMTAKQLKENIGRDLEIIENVDKWTIRTVGKGKMKASYGVDSFVTGYGSTIPGCVDRAPV